MTNFSTNQVMQFYVADSVTVLPSEGKAFKLKFGDITSDRIENIEWAKLTKASALTPKVKKVTVTFSGTIVTGENYSVKVSYPEIGGAGVESWTTKTAVAYAGKGVTANNVIADLKTQLTAILGVDDVLTVSGDTSTIIITPKTTNLKYERGIRPIAIPDFTVVVNQVVDEGELVDWATINTASQTTSIPSGYKLADMEYFAMGERGDEYRMAAYPNHIITDYKIVPTNEYDVYNIHYAYKGANDQSHKSEKDLIIAVTAGTELAALEAELTKLGVTLVTVPKAE